MARRPPPTATQSDDKRPRSSGRPRSEAARTATLDAAAELLLTRGLETVSMDELAKRAGVSKATIYRWWSTKEELALDALYRGWATAAPAATGSLRSDLLALLLPWVRRAVARPYALVVSALIRKVHTDPEFAERYREQFVGPRREPGRAAFRAAIERGEISPDVNIEVALDLLYGALYHRLLHLYIALDERFVHELVEMVLNGVAPAGAPASNGDGSRR